MTTTHTDQQPAFGSPPILITSGYLGPAEVLESNPDERFVLIRWHTGGQSCRSWAQAALAFSNYQLHPGDTVLVLSQNLADFYIIGMLHMHQHSRISNRASGVGDGESSIARSASGATASVSSTAPSHETLEIHSARGELLFEYEPQSGKARVHVPVGDLEFVAPNGSIAFHSGRDIRFGASAISLLSRWGACLGIFGADGKVRSAITLEPESVKVKTPELNAEADHANLEISQTHLSGESLTARVGIFHLLCHRFEMLTETLIEKAKNAYRSAEQLSQTQAGRLRTIVRDLCYVKARKAIFKADEDFKVDGDKIHIG